MSFALDHFDGSEQAAEDFAGAIYVAIQSVLELRNQFAVALDAVDQRTGYLIFSLVETAQRGCAIRFCLCEAGLQGGREADGGNCVDQARNLRLDFGNSRTGCPLGRACLAASRFQEFANGELQLSHRGRAQQLVANNAQQARINLRAGGMHANAY